MPTTVPPLGHPQSEAALARGHVEQREARCSGEVEGTVEEAGFVVGQARGDQGAPHVLSEVIEEGLEPGGGARIGVVGGASDQGEDGSTGPATRTGRPGRPRRP